MNVKIACAAVFGLAIVGAFVIGVSSTVSAQGKSQWDGIYSEEQAKRGEPLYAEKCSSCHGADMNGGEMAPGLAGGEFSANWNDLARRPLRTDADFDAAEQPGEPEPPTERRHSRGDVEEGEFSGWQHRPAGRGRRSQGAQVRRRQAVTSISSARG